MRFRISQSLKVFDRRIGTLIYSPVSLHVIALGTVFFFFFNSYLLLCLPWVDTAKHCQPRDRDRVLPKLEDLEADPNRKRSHSEADAEADAEAMVLWMIGLGLGDEGDISVKGLKAVQRRLECMKRSWEKNPPVFGFPSIVGWWKSLQQGTPAEKSMQKQLNRMPKRGVRGPQFKAGFAAICSKFLAHKKCNVGATYSMQKRISIRKSLQVVISCWIYRLYRKLPNYTPTATALFLQSSPYFSTIAWHVLEPLLPGALMFTLKRGSADGFLMFSVCVFLCTDSIPDLCGP